MAAIFSSIPFLGGRFRAGGRPHHNLVLSHDERLRILPSWWARGFAAFLAIAYFVIPSMWSSATLDVLSLCAAYAIGAIGLNLLTGYTGQVSLGHAAFLGVGAYCASYLGHVEGWPFPAYLVAAALIGLALGGLVGPFALRLRGNYLAVVTIGLVFLAEHIFKNWESVTGGGIGARTNEASITLGPLDFRDLHLFGKVYTDSQAFFWLSWALVALAALTAKNLVRTRPGRAMQAVRDRDLSAEVIGVDLARTKVGAFAIACSMASVAGVVYALLQKFVVPEELSGTRGLFLSITFVAIIIIGGVGTVFGSILGALLVVYGQRFIADNSDIAILDPLVEGGSGGFLTTGELNRILFGLLVVIFLLVEPRGLAALWMRVKIWFLSWPFSY
jgi:branched-chain amino acid transport system permease protein